MATYHIAALLIAFIGVTLVAGTSPVLRLAGRHSMVEPVFNEAMIKWLARGLGVIFLALGLVTFVQQ